MSGRPTQNRGGKRSHKNSRGFDSSTGHGGRDSRGGAQRHSNDPPPRFAKRNGDVRSGRGEPKSGFHDYDDHSRSSSRSSEGGGFKPRGNGTGGRSSFDELMQLLSRLESSSDYDGSCRLAQQIVEFFELHAGDYRLSQLVHTEQNTETIFKTLNQIILNNAEREVLVAVEQCIGFIGHALGRDAQRLVEWVFQNVHPEDVTDDVRAVYLRGLHEALSSEGGKSPHSTIMPLVIDSLQTVLDMAETSVLLEAVVKNIIIVAKHSPQHLGRHFQNTVDILVGWHIDIQQDPQLIESISAALVCFREFWIKDMLFSTDLLKQFLEDMEAYCSELSGLSDGLSVAPEESSSPEQCASRLTALIKVFTTVLRSLGTSFSPSRCGEITPDFVQTIVRRVTRYVLTAHNISPSEDLLISGNLCLMELSRCLQGGFASCCAAVATYIVQQLDNLEVFTDNHSLSVINLLAQIAEDVQVSLSTGFVQQVFSLDSPLLHLRYTAGDKLLSQLVKLYLSFLAIRNIPLLEAMYRLILADLDSSLKALSHCFKQPLSANLDDEEAVFNPIDAQVGAIFSLNVLSQVSNTAKNVIEMWSPTPSVFSFLSSLLTSLSPTLASEYPTIHFSILYALFQDSRSNHYYIPGSGSSSSSLSVGVSSRSSTSSGGTVCDIIFVLTKLMRDHKVPFDICRLIQRWVDYITEALRSVARETLPLEKLSQAMDALTCQMLTFSFSREHSVRVDNAAVLKGIFQCELVSDRVLKLCVPECLLRLSDTRGEIRAAYSALLEVIPTHIVTSFSRGVEAFQPPNGRKGLEGLRSCKGTWHARRIHMTKQSQVTFHGHHFKAIMGFIMHGFAPSKHLPDDWLERMYHSCQHRRPPVPESLDNPELHPLLMSHLVCNCDAVLWFWATYESAQYCLLARLRTPLGMPAETFTAIETVLRGYAQEVGSRDGRALRDTPSSFSGHMGAGLGPRHYTVHLRAILLLQFMEHLDKLMYNAYEGSCVTLPPVPKSVRSFFRKNMDTCLEWLAHVRGYIVSIAIRAGMPAVAIRHGFAALQDLGKMPHAKNNAEFWKMLVNVIHALLLSGSWHSIRGMGAWVKNIVGHTPSWIIAAEAQAKSSYETASEEYVKALDMLRGEDMDKPYHAINAPIIEFIVNRVCECYVHVTEWVELEAWHKHVNSLQAQSSSSSDVFNALNLKYDLNQIHALSSFDAGNMAQAREFAENQSDPRHMSRDPEVFPLWDPGQLLSTSQLLLLRTATLGEEGSGSDDTTSVTSEGEYGPKSNVQRWLKLSSAYAESPLRVGCLEWPLRVSPGHALQLQAVAALKALNPIKSRHAQPSSSSLLLYPIPFKSLNASNHDTGIWSEALRMSSYLSSAQSSADNHTPSVLFEAYRLARREGNLKHAHYLIQRHILSLTGEAEGADAIEELSTSTHISHIEKLRILRELAKLYTSRGQSAPAIELLSSSVVNYCDTQKGPMTSGGLGSGSELTARSLHSIVKWMQADTRIMQTAWSPEYEATSRLHYLLSFEYDCRKARLGLYQTACSTDSHELFQPDESVARFDKHEYSIGQLLHLATMHCPDLAKGWWSLAGWCYRIGRKNLEALSATGTAELLDHEQKQVDEIIKNLTTVEQRSAILQVLGQVHISDATDDEDLKAKEEVKHLDMEEDSKSLKGQLLSVCPLLDTPSSLDGLLAVWSGVRVRMFMHYQLAARAYFTFLKLSGTQSGSSSGLDDMNVTATLRLLRLLVKYAVELKSELQSGFETTPTKPWKGIIPQLFSRLNHPENDVRQSVSDLLCRVGNDAPHFIIYPAIVGASKKTEKKTESMSGLLDENREEARDNEKEYDLGSRDLIGDGLTPPDTELNSDEDGEATAAEMTNLEKSLAVIIDSLKQQNATLVKSVQDLVDELCRITLLWDEMWLAALMQRQGEVHRRLLQIDQETKRTMAIPHLNNKEKQCIMREKYMATMRPLLWVLEHLASITSQPAETPNERNFQAQYGDTINSALLQLRNPDNFTSPHTVWEPFKEFQTMLMHRAQKRMQNSLSLHEISPHLAAIRSSCITMPGHSQGDEPVTLESFHLEVAVLPTKTKPKKISMIGSDGRKHTYLFKGLEDLHLDERIMQFMDIINNMFARAHKHQTQLYVAKDYAVIPLGARSGLIQWVDAVTPLFGIYKRWQQREAYAKALEQAGSQPTIPLPIQVLKPNELFYSKIMPLLKEKGMAEQTPRKDWPPQIQLRVLKELMAETPSDLLEKELWCASSCASEWWAAIQTYNRSTAVMCMIGYIIGLGDRHLDNLLVHFSTGQIVHVDYNVCFEKGRSLRVPERVPFRMTQNIARALGFTGVEGLFRISCEDILRILRRGRETLLTLLEAFVYDPLIDWTQSEDAAFPLAVRTTKDMTTRQTRKEMEREVASGMLATRLAESVPYWNRNRENLLAVLVALELHLGEIAKTGEKLANYHETIIQLDRQNEILRDALSTPDHPLITMQDKLSEQSKLMAEHKRLLADISRKYQEALDWNVKHKDAFRTIHGAGLGALISHMQNPLDLGPPGHEPAVEFLQSIHQNQAVDACDQLEDELVTLLQKRRGVLIGALDALHQYRNITSQFDIGYLKQSRSYLWEECAGPMIEGHDHTHDMLKQVITDFEDQLSANSRPPQVVKTVDSKFRKSVQELHLRFTKLHERSKSVPSTDNFDTTIIETKNHLSQFCIDNREHGPPSLACFIIVALCPLSRRWLFMEQTAQAARERLSDLTSRDGDWFLDELCTMGGNVSQMVGLLEMCLVSMGYEFQAGSVLKATIDAVASVQKVYAGMQDLFNKFQSLILPEAINNILTEDEGVLEMIDTVVNFTLSSYPGMSIQDALSALNTGLTEYANKSLQADLSMTGAVEEMRTKMNNILNNPDREGPMSPAQVILNSMNGLFQFSEVATKQMMEDVDKIDIPESWENIDLVKQTESLMCTTAGLSLTDELLYVRKAQAIVDFCVECKSLLKALKLEISTEGASTPTATPPGTPGRRSFSIHVPTQSSLTLPIRRYISGTLITHVLGQPSFSLATFLISANTQYLGIELPGKQITLEDVCKLANDHYQNVLPMSVITHARSLFSQHDVAWRESDRARRIATNLENCKLALHRAKSIATRFQWLYEEMLSSSDPHHQPLFLGPQRSIILTTIRKVLSNQLSTSLTAVQDKINSHQFRISQRLQWAAGANPALNSIVDEFERATNRRKQILQEEEDIYSKIYEYCNAVIHLESSHTRVAIQTTNDKEMIQLLSRCADTTLKLQLCSEQLSQVSDIVHFVELPEDGGPLTLQWMQRRLDEIGMERTRIHNEKRADNTKLAKHKEAVLSELEKLRGYNRAHRKLMVEIWQHLTALARLEDPPPPGTVQPGPRAFINLQNKFGEEVRSFIQSTQELIASDMSLAAKPTWTSKARAQEFLQAKRSADNLKMLAECLLDQLLSFTQQLFCGQPCGTLKWSPPPLLERILPASISTVSIASQAAASVTDGDQQQTKIYRSSQGVVRDKRTGKALQEQNSYAVSVWRRVKAKLDGRDPDATYRLTVAEQVKFVIDEATSLENLSQLYEGWTPWV